MHGHSRSMTIDPRTPTMPRRSTSGFHLCEAFGESHEGRAASYKEPLMRRTWTWMTASMTSFIFGCGHSQRQQWGCYVIASWAPYHKHYVMRSFPVCGVKLLHPAQTIYDSIGKKSAPWLSSSRSELHVLQCRRQPTPTQPMCSVGGGGRGSLQRSCSDGPNRSKEKCY